MALQTIAVGVDFSPQAEEACRQALAIARTAGARVVLVHVTALPDPPEGLPESMRATAAAYLDKLRARATETQRDLAAIGDRLSGQGAEISHVMVDGFADDGLLTAAEELKADLIVTGSHGRRGLGRFLMGSTAERVVRSAHVPVLVARGNPEAFHRICVATDFSDAAERGVESALELAAPEAQIDLVHFWDLPSLPRAHATDEVDAVRDELRDGLLAHGRERGATAIAAHPDRTIRYELREGDAADGITAWAVDTKADLVVVGSHGRRGLRRLLLGSVAEATVRHAPCSVLVAR